MIFIEWWKPIVIKDIETKYYISNLGNVRTYDGKIKKGDIDKHGYEVTSLSVNKKKYRILTHRLVAMAFIPNPMKKRTVNHKDYDRLNNKASNLEWYTDSEQQIHAHKNPNRKQYFGEKHHLSKYSDELVCEIYEYLRNGYRQKEICLMTGVSITYVNKLIHLNFRKNIINVKGIPREYRSGPKSKYPDELINEICEMIQSGMTNKDIKNKLNLEERSDVVRDIRRKKFAKHISKNYNF